jgi:hypothetical protein
LEYALAGDVASKLRLEIFPGDAAGLEEGRAGAIWFQVVRFAGV